MCKHGPNWTVLIREAFICIHNSESSETGICIHILYLIWGLLREVLLYVNILTTNNYVYKLNVLSGMLNLHTNS